MDPFNIGYRIIRTSAVAIIKCCPFKLPLFLSGITAEKKNTITMKIQAENIFCFSSSSVSCESLVSSK